jgi:DNA-binding MarR family transcriptional regulator
MDLDLIGFLKDGKYRIKILEELNKSPNLPSEISKKLNIHRASTSRILKMLAEKQLIESHSNKSRTTLYSISNKGKKILEEII